jgi:competence protein ComEC
MKGGAKLHIMRPLPESDNPNNRSAPIKLVGPDSASFTMWLAGDAEREAIDWFLHGAEYGRDPGMQVNVLKADHHGSCNGVSQDYLDALGAGFVVVSVGALNSYGHMHTQAKAAFRENRLDWMRTDDNGTITIHTPGVPKSGFEIYPQRNGRVHSPSGRSDKRSTQKACKER